MEERYPLVLAIYPSKQFDVVTIEECNRIKPKVALPDGLGFDGQRYMAIGPYKKGKSTEMYCMMIFCSYNSAVRQRPKMVDIGYLPSTKEVLFDFLGITKEALNKVTFSKPIYINVETDILLTGREREYAINLYKDGKTYYFERKR